MAKKHKFEPERKGGRICNYTDVYGGTCGMTEDYKGHVGVKTEGRTVTSSPVFAMPYGLTSFEGGATRSHKPERRELIPKSAVDALARRLALGAEKHGVDNWKQGGAEFRLATVNHLLDHVFAYLEKGGKENTDAIICNAAFLCEFEEKEPYKAEVSE